MRKYRHGRHPGRPQSITTLAPYGFVLKYFSEQVKDIPRAAFVAALQLEGISCDGLFDERSIAVLCSRSIRPIFPL
jgi:hypothetical protein